MATPAAILNVMLVANTKAADTALAGTQARLRATAATSTRTSATMKKAFLGIGLAAGAVGTALFKIGDEFDQVSDKIRTQTGASGKELKKLEGSFKNVVKTVPTDFGSAADAIAGLNQRLGLTGRPLEKLTKQVTQLALVTGTDVKENVEAVTRLFGDWEVATKDQTETLDGLFRISQDTGTSVSELSRNLVQFGAPLRNLGIDMDFAAAMFANFEKTGVNMTTVLSGLRLGVGNLNTPTDDLAKALDKLDISLKNPQKALVEIFDSIKTLDKQAATALGIEAFGKRAGPDLVDTVRGGKFELDKLIASFEDGDETIGKAERSTRDFSEQWTLFINRAKTFLEPVATAFFKAIGDGMKALNRLDLDQVGKSLRDFWQKAGFLRDVVAKVSVAIKENFKGLGQFIKGVVQTISGVLTGNFGRAWDGVKNIFQSGIKSIISMVKGLTSPLRAALQGIADIIKDVFVGAWRGAKNAVENAANSILGTTHHLTVEINKGFKSIFQLTNNALKAFGVKAVAYDLAGAVAEGAQGKQKGGLIVGGTGTGDKVPAMLEPGEVVLNRKAVAAMGGAGKANAINSMIPRFASGGVVQQALGPYDIPPIQYDPNHAGGNSHLHLDFFSQAQAIAYGKKMQGMGWSVGEYSGPYGGFGPITTTHQSPGHYDGTAFDANTAADETRSEVAAVARLLGGAGGIAKVAEKIARVLLKGPDGPLKSMGQAALDKVRNAANSYISKQQPKVTSGSSEFIGGAPIKSLPKALQKWNKQYPYDSAESMPYGEIRKLAAWQGLPGWFWKITIGESAGQPGAVGHDPGGTTGYGLYQETDPFANAYVKAVTGGLDYTKMLNPVLNTMAAKLHFQAAPSQTPNTPGFPWYGTQFLAKGGKVKGVTPSGYTFGQGPTGVDATPRPYNTIPSGTAAALFWLSANVTTLEEQIANAQTLAGFSTSEMGTALGPTEKAQQIALNDQLLAALINNASYIRSALSIPYLDPSVISDLTSNLHTIQGVTGAGGKILQVRQALDELSAVDTSSGPDLAAINALLSAQLLESQQRYNVSQAQYGVFGGMPQVVGGGFASGGVVTTPAPTVNVNVDSGMSWLRQFIRTEIEDVNRTASRGRARPGARGY